MAVGLPLKMAGFCVVWALFWLAGSATVSTSTTAFAGGEAVVVDSRSAVAVTDDFVCAILDWWPPEKCDYGTCSWGQWRRTPENLGVANATKNKIDDIV
jgi:heparanase